MFWGVTLESGKRYSQKVAESYHLSMATLETLPGDLKPQNKEVAVMIEHGEAEYQLCVLEYGRIMQVSLDLIFDYGEVVTYFLNGEGTVHLTGYALADADDDTGSRGKRVAAANVAGDEDDDEEDDEDWTPSKEMVQNSDSSESEESDEDEDDESDDESETEQVLAEKLETNEDEDIHDAKRKRKSIVKNSKTKKRKICDSSPTQNGTAKGKFKAEKQQRSSNNLGSGDSNNSMSGNDDFEDMAEEEEENDDSVEYSSEEEKEKHSSAGRTPMPPKRVSSKTSLGESPDLPAQQKGKLKNTSDISSSNKGTIPVTPQNARKINGNVHVEDLKIGSGLPAKNGKFVFLHYIGKLQNGKVFETCEAPKKPFAFRLGKGEVIRGLEIGVQGMKTGGKRRITIPPNMGYGKETNDVIPANSTLLFTVELKGVR